MKKVKRFVRLSERKDTKRILAIYKNAPVVILNGIFTEIAFLF